MKYWKKINKYIRPPWHGARTCKVLRKYINAFPSYSAETKRDGRTDGRMGGVAISPVPGPAARREIKIELVNIEKYVQSIRIRIPVLMLDIYYIKIHDCHEWKTRKCILCFDTFVLTHFTAVSNWLDIFIMSNGIHCIKVINNVTLLLSTPSWS